MKEANKVNKIERSQMNRVKEEQRNEMLSSFRTIANGDKTLYNKMVEGYDANHLVVGTRIDNWLVIKESSPEANELVDTINQNFASLTSLIKKQGLQVNKKGTDLLGTPKATHKVEIVIPKEEGKSEA